MRESEPEAIMISVGELLDRIQAIVDENWTRRASPALLSFIGSVLAKEGIDFKSHSPDGKLATFINLYKDRFVVKQHPVDKLVSGVIPAGCEYEFPAPDISRALPVPSDGTEDESLKKSRGALYTFIRELAKLPKAEANSVVIPTSVLIRLLEGK